MQHTTGVFYLCLDLHDNDFYIHLGYLFFIYHHNLQNNDGNNILYLFEYNVKNFVPKTPTKSLVRIIHNVLDKQAKKACKYGIDILYNLFQHSTGVPKNGISHTQEGMQVRYRYFVSPVST